MPENLNPESVLPALTELALDLRWSWNHSTDELWGQLDPILWEMTKNPWVLLQIPPRQTVRNACADPAFRKKVEQMILHKREEEARKSWFDSSHPAAALARVAYFSMEFMLSEALPIY